MSCHLVSNSLTYRRIRYSLSPKRFETFNFAKIRERWNIRRDNFWDRVSLNTMSWDVKDQCAEFRVRPRFTVGFRVCDDYYDLRIPYAISI